MRYLIDAGENQREDLEELIESEGFKLVDKYEPVAKLSLEVEKLGISLREFKKSGVSWEIFVYYLRGKGHSQAQIDSLMGDVAGFFKKMGILP